MKNKIINFHTLGLCSLAALAGLAISTLSTSGLFAQRQQPLVPYSADVVERRVDHLNEVSRFNRTLARKADGSIAVKEVRFYTRDGQPVELPFTDIHDAGKRQLISLHPKIQAQTTSPLSEAKVVQLAAKPHPTCSLEGTPFADRVRIESALGQERLLSYPVVVRTISNSDSATAVTGSKTTTREWVAPDLDCLVLKRVSVVENAKGPEKATTTLEVLRVVTGDPSPSLFEVPPGLVEMPPSQVIREHAKLEGRTCKDCEQRLMENADRLYQAARAAK